MVHVIELGTFQFLKIRIQRKMFCSNNVHVIEHGNGLVTFQLRGLEFRGKCFVLVLEFINVNNRS